MPWVRVPRWRGLAVAGLVLLVALGGWIVGMVMGRGTLYQRALECRVQADAVQRQLDSLRVASWE